MALSVSIEEIIESSNDPLLQIPHSWNRTLLKDIAEVLNGYAFKSSKFNKSKGIPLLRIRDINKNTTETLFEGEFDPKYIVERGDLVVGMDGDFNCSRWNGPRALLNQRVCKISIISTNYDIRFLALVLPGYLKAINNYTSSITVKHLSSKTIENIPLPYPTLEKQRKIAALIEELFTQLDAGVASLKRVKEALKRYKASVLKAAVEGRLVSQDPSDEPAEELLRLISKKPQEKGELAGLPDGWVCVKISDVSNIITKGSSPKWQGFDYQDSGITFIRSQNVDWGKLNLDSLVYLSQEFNQKESRSIIHLDDVLLNIVGASIGRAAKATSHIAGGNLNQAVAIIRLRKNIISSDFLVNLLISPDMQHNINLEKVDVARANVSLSDIRDMSISLPPINEQYRIVAEVARRLSASTEIEAAVEKGLKRAKRLRQSILKKAFEGRLLS
jgi:type I restriction enzyme, S subunit